MAAGLKKRRRTQLVAVGAVSLALATAMIGYGLRGGIEYFRTPSQIASDPPPPGARLRLGGLVEEGSVERGTGREVRFVVTDGGARLPVVFAGLLPDLFREGQGVVATGALSGGEFVASEVLARHDQSYMPKEVADALEEQGLLRYGAGIDPQPGS
jgi:cytochrome c-type biogenesis protein CcmE